jgi:hypothetical protein
MRTQALQLHLFCEDAMDDCWRDLVEVLSHLPYLGCIHDGPIVVGACDELFSKAKKKGDAAAQAVCKAVASFFMPARTPDHRKEIFPLVRAVLSKGPGSVLSDPARAASPIPLLISHLTLSSHVNPFLPPASIPPCPLVPSSLVRQGQGPPSGELRPQGLLVHGHGPQEEGLHPQRQLRHRG